MMMLDSSIPGTPDAGLVFPCVGLALAPFAAMPIAAWIWAGRKWTLSDGSLRRRKENEVQGARFKALPSATAAEPEGRARGVAGCTTPDSRSALADSRFPGDAHSAACATIRASAIPEQDQSDQRCKARPAKKGLSKVQSSSKCEFFDQPDQSTINRLQEQ